MESKIFVVIIAICVLLLIIGFLKNRYDLLVNFGLRLSTGLLGIYLLNILLSNFGLALGVGTNGYSALIVGLFGMPGFVLVYGLAAYFYMV